MKGKNNRRYAAGVLLVLFGGAGLAEISTSNHGCFWVCTIALAIGTAICVTEYFHD